MAESLLRVGDAAKEFLATLDAIPDEEWVRPPGLVGPYRAKHVRQGLKTGAIVVHYSGRGLVWTATTSAATLYRLIEADDKYPPAKPEAIKQLLATFKRMQLGLGPKKVAVPAGADALSWDL